MASSRSDYILRMIEEIGAALARLRERLARGVPAGEVAGDAERSQAELFGPLWPTLRLVDSDTAAGLVTDQRQLELWVELMRLEADAAGLGGDAERADRLRQRAEAIQRSVDTRAVL